MRARDAVDSAEPAYKGGFIFDTGRAIRLSARKLNYSKVRLGLMKYYYVFIS